MVMRGLATAPGLRGKGAVEVEDGMPGAVPRIIKDCAFDSEEDA